VIVPRQEGGRDRRGADRNVSADQRINKGFVARGSGGREREGASRQDLGAAVVAERLGGGPGGEPFGLAALVAGAGDGLDDEAVFRREALGNQQPRFLFVVRDHVSDLNLGPPVAEPAMPPALVHQRSNAFIIDSDFKHLDVAAGKMQHFVLDLGRDGGALFSLSRPNGQRCCKLSRVMNLTTA
jgi:hypothetical protein